MLREPHALHYVAFFFALPLCKLSIIFNVKCVNMCYHYGISLLYIQPKLALLLYITTYIPT